MSNELKTKVFISWSGDRSKALAHALKEFVGDVLQTVEAFVSDRDIEAGQRWLQRLDGELRDTRHGILCLTSENLGSPWLHYEAGALAKLFDGEERICTCLLDVANSDIDWPLAQFQHKQANKEGIQEILKSINNVLPESQRLPPDRLLRQYGRCWSDLKTLIDGIPAASKEQSPSRSERELLVEILETVRNISSPTGELSRKLQDAVRRRRVPSRKRARAVAKLADCLYQFNNGIDEAAAADDAARVAAVFLQAAETVRGIMVNYAELLTVKRRHDCAGLAESLVTIANDVESENFASEAEALRHRFNLIIDSIVQRIDV